MLIRQENAGSVTTPLPTEFVTSFARGSMRHSVPTTNLYSSPATTPGTSADQLPFPSDARGVAVWLQALKLPATDTFAA